MLKKGGVNEDAQLVPPSKKAGRDPTTFLTPGQHQENPESTSAAAARKDLLGDRTHSSAAETEEIHADPVQGQDEPTTPPPLAGKPQALETPAKILRRRLNGKTKPPGEVSQSVDSKGAGLQKKRKGAAGGPKGKKVAARSKPDSDWEESDGDDGWDSGRKRKAPKRKKQAEGSGLEEAESEKEETNSEDEAYYGPIKRKVRRFTKPATGPVPEGEVEIHVKTLLADLQGDEAKVEDLPALELKIYDELFDRLANPCYFFNEIEAEQDLEINNVDNPPLWTLEEPCCLVNFFLAKRTPPPEVKPKVFTCCAQHLSPARRVKLVQAILNIKENAILTPWLPSGIAERVLELHNEPDAPTEETYELRCRSEAALDHQMPRETGGEEQPSDMGESDDIRPGHILESHLLRVYDGDLDSDESDEETPPEATGNVAKLNTNQDVEEENGVKKEEPVKKRVRKDEEEEEEKTVVFIESTNFETPGISWNAETDCFELGRTQKMGSKKGEHLPELEVEPELFYDDAFEHKEGKEEAFEEAKEVLAELNKKGQIPPEALLEEEDPMDIEPGVWRRDNQLWTVDEDDEVLGNGKLEIKFPEFFAGEDSPEAKDEARQDFLRLYVRRFLKRGEIRFEEEDPEFQKRKEDAAKRQQKEDAAKQQNKVGVTRIELQEDPLTQSAKARCKNERHITWHKGRRCFQVRLFQGASNLLCFCATFKPESRNLAGVEAALKQAIQARDQFLAKASLTQRRA